MVTKNPIADTKDNGAPIDRTALEQEKVRDLEAERDALRRQLAQVRETLAAAPECPTWAALAGLVGKAARLASSEGTT